MYIRGCEQTAKLQESSYDLRDRENLIPLVGSNPTGHTNFRSFVQRIGYCVPNAVTEVRFL